ncbi:MAG: type II toxin-antitoxin system mRNA interferase toxin, RelE/StbE family [Candidatus Paceibacterota bacterium]
MMVIILERSFEKKYKKLKEKEKLKQKINIFISDEFDPTLNNHSLKGKYIGYRSINITGDLRAVYKKKDNISIFAYIDNHNNLYK